MVLLLALKLFLHLDDFGLHFFGVDKLRIVQHVVTIKASDPRLVSLSFSELLEVFDR